MLLPLNVPLHKQLPVLDFCFTAISYHIPRLAISQLNKDVKNYRRVMESREAARLNVWKVRVFRPGFYLAEISSTNASQSVFFVVTSLYTCNKWSDFVSRCCHTNLYSCIRHLGNQGCRRIQNVQHLPGKTRFDHKMANSLVQQLKEKEDD